MNDDDAALRQGLQDARNAVDEVRQRQAKNVDHAFAQAASRFYALRNRMLDDRRAGRLQDVPADLQDRMNAIASLMAGVEYPLAGIHWKRMDKIDEALGKLLDEWKARAPV